MYWQNKRHIYETTDALTVEVTKKQKKKKKKKKKKNN